MKLIPKFLSGKVLGPKEYFGDYLSSKGVKRIINNAYKWMDNYYSNPWNAFMHKVTKNNKDYGGINRYKELIPKAQFNIDTSRYLYYTGKPYSLPGLRRVFSNPKYKDASMYGSTRIFDDDYADAHEYGHVFTWNLPITRPAIDLFNSVDTYLPFNEHDSRFEEKWADLEALRYLLYKTGIYDSREIKDITPEQILKMRNLYKRKNPNIFDRLLESEPSNEKIAEMLNTIVSNLNKTELEV